MRLGGPPAGVVGVSDVARDVGAALVLVSAVGIPWYAVMVTWFPEHTLAMAAIFVVFALGIILLAYGSASDRTDPGGDW